MKKTVLLIFFFTIFLKSGAQNWQLVKSNKVQWFRDTKPQPPGGYGNVLKVIFVDSFKTINQDSVFYFPVTLGTRTKNPTGPKVKARLSSPWWVGSKMILRNDGSQLFFNAENDTLIFYADKSLAEEWVMVKFTNGNYVNAKIKSVGTDIVSGLTDSIKTIEIRKYSKDGIPGSFYPDIVISKNNGFINVFPLFSVLDSWEWIYELHTNKYTISSYILSTIGKKLLYRDVYGFDKGDVFQVVNVYNMKKTKILDKQDFGDSVKFYIEEEYGDLRGGYHIISLIQSDWWIHNYNTLFSQRYPEQYDTGHLVEYIYRINTCGLIVIDRRNVSTITIDDTLYYHNFEAPVYKSTHGEHLGMVDSSLITIEGLFNYKFSLIYSKNKYCNIGVNPMGIITKSNASEYNLSPNPVQSNFRLTGSKPIENIRIFNSIGEEVVLNSVNGSLGNIVFDTSGLETGIYHIIINSNSVIRFVKCIQ